MSDNEAVKKEELFAPEPGAAPEEMVRNKAVAEVTQIYWESLEYLGVRSYVIGIPLGESPTGHGALRAVGRSDIVLNLLAGLIKMLVPQDFDNLVTEMMYGKYFEQQRTEAKILRAAQTPQPQGKPN